MTCHVVLEISHMSGTISRQGHMTYPVYFLWYQKFDVSCTFPRSRTPVHFMYMSCNIRNFIFHVNFQEKGT